MNWNQSFDLESVAARGDRLLHTCDRWCGLLIHQFKLSLTIPVKLFDLTFPSPIIISSFKGDLKTLQIWLKMGAGGVITKTILKEERQGNIRPRLQEIFIDGNASLINSMGLPGEGIDKFLQKLESSELMKYTDRPLGISIGGNSLDEYIGIIDKICRWLKSRSNQNVYFEINISCPNTPEGQDMGKHPALISELLTNIRKKTDRVMGIKVSPDMSNHQLEEIGKIVTGFDRTYINAGNTKKTHRKSVGLNKSDFPNETGGLSGPDLFIRTLEMVRLFKTFTIPVMATGGIHSIKQIQLLKNEGAILFGMATAIVQDPYRIPILNRTLSKD